MFSDVLKLLRKKHGMTQDDLAKKLGLGKSTIAMYETGKRMPDYDTFIALARLFNVDINYLYSFTTLTAEKDNLSDGERMLLELFRDASPYQQEVILRMIAAAVTPRE